LYFRERKIQGNEFCLPSSIGRFLFYLLDYPQNNDWKSVPRLIRESDIDVRCSFLRALYDDDGYLYVSKRMIVISLCNYELVNGVRDLVKA
jgi:hypothetical protein